MGSIELPMSIEDLRAKLSPAAEIVTQDSPREVYEEAVERWARSSIRNAEIIIFPTTVEDVSEAVKFGFGSGLEVAIVGGRHATGGSSSREGGMHLDLAKMRSITVDEKNKTATAEGGCRWRDVDLTLSKYGLAAVGGTYNDTGIGGLTLGGGYGWLSCQYGMVIDNLVGAEIVLADGRILQCSDNENAGLFWALRGAGWNFGVVTKFAYRVHEMRDPVFAGLMFFDEKHVAKIFEISNQIRDTNDGRATIIVAFGVTPDTARAVPLVIVFYNGTEEEGKAIFAPFFNLKPDSNTTGPIRYVEVNTMLDNLLLGGYRRSFKGTSTLGPFPIPFAEELFRDFNEHLTKIPDAKRSSIIFDFVPPQKICEVGQTETAFPGRGNIIPMIFEAGWEDEKNDFVCREWTRVMHAKTKADRLRRMAEMEVDGDTALVVGEYSNLDALGVGAEILFGVNYPRLVELKKQYDPTNFFNTARNNLIETKVKTSAMAT